MDPTSKCSGKDAAGGTRNGTPVASFRQHSSRVLITFFSEYPVVCIVKTGRRDAIAARLSEGTLQLSARTLEEITCGAPCAMPVSTSLLFDLFALTIVDVFWELCATIAPLFNVSDASVIFRPVLGTLLLPCSTL